MKIEWLDEDRTRATLVRGFGRWRRAATVHLDKHRGWLFDVTDDTPSYDERSKLTGERLWRKPATLPIAKVVE